MAAANEKTLTPGTTVSVQLVRGDYSVAAAGTEFLISIHRNLRERDATGIALRAVRSGSGGAHRTGRRAWSLAIIGSEHTLPGLAFVREQMAAVIQLGTASTG